MHASELFYFCGTKARSFLSSVAISGEAVY